MKLEIKTEALEFMKEKYRIAIAVKEYERAKEYLLKIRELEAPQS